jgi:hypothetical protein
VAPFWVTADFLSIFSYGWCTQADDRSFYLIDDDRSMPFPARDIDDTIFSNNMFFVFKPELNFSVKIEGVFDITSKKPDILVTIVTVGLSGFFFVNRAGNPDAFEIELLSHTCHRYASRVYPGNYLWGVAVMTPFRE